MSTDAWPAAEEWRAIDGCDGWYEVSSHGRVRSWKTVGRPGVRASAPTLRKLQLNTNGRLAVSLRRRSEKAMRPQVHRLVAAAFMGTIPDDKVVCHSDGNPMNNHVGNLRIDTASNNEADKVIHGTSNRGERNPGARLTVKEVRDIRQLLEQGARRPAMARLFGVTPDSIRNIQLGLTWAHVA